MSSLFKRIYETTMNQSSGNQFSTTTFEHKEREREKKNRSCIHKINYNDDDDVNGNTPTEKNSIMDNAYYNMYTLLLLS